MMNRTAIGLAIGAGYLLGRTRKMKLALAAGSLLAGKRLNLAPGAVGQLVTRQLKDNPQFKEIGDELREDLRGVGKAASGALVERQISALADRLHDRTADVRDQLSDTVRGMDTRDGEAEEPEGPEETEEPSAEDDTGREEEPGHEEDDRSRGHRRSRRDEESGKADEDGRPSRRRTAGNAPSKKTAGKAPTAKKETARKSAPGTRRTTRAGGRKGGDEQ